MEGRDSGPQKTASGREIKKVGMNDSKKSALQRLKEAREGTVKRTDQYQVRKYTLVKHHLAG
jgi:hypothetical protein